MISPLNVEYLSSSVQRSSRKSGYVHAHTRTHFLKISFFNNQNNDIPMFKLIDKTLLNKLESGAFFNFIDQL